MCRSSRVALLLLIISGAAPTDAAVVHTRAIHIETRSSSRGVGRIGSGDRRGRGGYGFGGYGYAVGGFGFGAVGFDGVNRGLDVMPPPLPAGPALPPPIPASPPPPPCPLIIKVGRGLANPVATKVVYGHRSCT